VSTSAKTRTLAAARTRAPADAGTVTTTAAGSRPSERSSGLPQTGEMHISCRCSCGLTWICTVAPSVSEPGIASPSTTGKRPSIPSGGVGCENECVMHRTGSPSASTRARPGRLM
jgi:hypothetical protein